MVFIYKVFYVMSNLYSKIHRLKAQGWTWEKFLQELDLIYPAGIDPKTLQGLYRHPHRKANSQISKAILELHNQQFPSPFPTDTQALLNIYNRLLSCKKHLSFDQDIKDFIAFLEEDIQLGNDLRKARLHWLKADIHLDQIPVLRNNGQIQAMVVQKELALDHYQQSYQLLITHNQQHSIPIDEFTMYKLQQNMLACHLNSLHSDKRYTDETLKHYLSSANFIQSSKRVLQSEPYQWIIARNGLRFSSINKNRADCLYFYRALIVANSAFADLNYKPNGAPPLMQSAEFQWAIQRLTKEDQ